MNKYSENSKEEFTRLLYSIAESNSGSIEDSLEYLSSEGINTDDLVSDGIKRIKQIKLKIKGDKNKASLERVKNFTQKATEYVENLLNQKDFSLSQLIQQERLSVSFRNVESLDSKDIKQTLISHFELKFSEEDSNEE